MSTQDSHTPHSLERAPRFGGRYEIVALLGSGGMGAVYKAIDHQLEEMVALKVLRLELADDATMLERFRREVKLARKVTHKNVARVFDIGEHDHQLYLTMELVAGETLDDRLARDGRLAPAEVVSLLTALCEGLAAAHDEGIVHRDLKPANVILHASGRPVITDFGIAKQPLGGATKLTHGAGTVLGTPAYMAPEQVVGGRIDHRADLYALGVMAFELLTGCLPFDGNTPLAMAAARLTQPPPSPRDNVPSVPQPLADVVLRCLAQDPADRFQDARELARVLKGLGGLAADPSRHDALTNAATVSLVPPAAVRAPPSALFGHRTRTVAVLPFENRSGPEDAFMAEGLTEDLRDSLTMVTSVRVIAHSALSTFLKPEVDLARLATELGVDVCVQGSFRRAGPALRVSVRLIHASDGIQVWAKRFDCPRDEALMVSDRAANAIAEALAVDHDRAPRHQAASTTAVELYLRARSEYVRAAGNIDKTVRLFREAADLAPDNPAILAGLALASARRWFYQGVGGEDVAYCVDRALAVAPESAEAHLALAASRFQQGDAVGAIKEATLTLQMAPGLSEAHLIVGRLLVEAGAVAEGCRALERAIVLDPDQEIARADWARALALDGRWDDAAALLSGAEGDPERWARALTQARIALWHGDTATVLSITDMLAQAEASGPDSPAAIARAIRHLVLTKEPGAAPPQTGSNANPRRVVFLAQLRAEVSSYVGHADAALEHVRAGADAGLLDLHWLEKCPLLAPMRALAGYPPIHAAVAAHAARVLQAYEDAKADLG